jgi:cytochrome c oxidase cbb3-type subunit 3
MSSDPEHHPKAEFARKKGEIVLRSHEYDGIREYDQMLPNWWLVIFYSSIVFFLGYWVLYYNFSLFQTDQEEIDHRITAIEETKARELQDMLSKLNDDALVGKWSTDPTVTSAGKQIFMSNCIACHGENLSARIDLGGGQSAALPGLPLTDGAWKYGAKPMDIFKLINEGTPADSTGNNGAKMEAWGQKLPPLQVAQLTAFLIHENPKDFPIPEKR